MRLIVSGYEPETVRYRFLWGFYVRGFNPWVHCQNCFAGERADGIGADMGDGEVKLAKPTEYFYLHGYALGPDKERGAKNLHLAVRPKAGAVSTVRSVFGPVFTIEDAEEIAIQGPLDGTSLPEAYSRCKNFRFGLQMYPTPLELLGPDAPKVKRMSGL